MAYRVTQAMRLNGKDYSGGETISDDEAADLVNVHGLVMAGLLKEEAPTDEPEPPPSEPVRRPTPRRK